MFNKYYEPSKKFSWVGLIILIAMYIALGSALAWVYLWINRECTVVILNVFAAIGYGILMGFLGRLIIKKCKLRNPTVVLIGILVGVLGMTYVKWAMYDYYDYQMIAEAYDDYDYTSYLKQEKAFYRFEMYYDFGDANGDYDEEHFDDNYEYLQNNAYTAISALYLSYSADINEDYSKEKQEKMKDCTLYEWYSYDTLLGKSKEECKKNLKTALEKNAYEYLKYMDIDIDDFIADYYGAYQAPSIATILAHPGDLWADIKLINEEGRWSYSSSDSSSSYSSSTTNSDPVNGVMLWIVWVCELLIIDLCAIFIAHGQSKHIFIEMDNDWAEVYDSNKFTFTNMSKMQLKSMLEQTGDNIANLTPIDPVSLIGRPYVKLTVSHSRDYSENYLNGYHMTYNAKNRNYVSSPAFTGLKITPKQTGMLFSMFGVSVPGTIASDAEFMNWMSSGSSTSTSSDDGYVQPQMEEVTPIAVPFNTATDSAASTADAVQTCGSCGTQVPAGKKFCPHCGAPFNDDGNGRYGF